MFEEFDNWLSWIHPHKYHKIDNYIEVAEEGKEDYDYKRVQIYTNEHTYSIVAHLPIPNKKRADGSPDHGYLGCIMSNRKPRPGEDWTRGIDLADGPYSEKTWHEILGDIIGMELERISKHSKPRIDVEKEQTVESSKEE